MFCPNCGAKVSEIHKFCYNCGQKLDFNQIETEKSVKAKKVGSKKANPRIKIKCTIQGMTRIFKPNGSYKVYNLGKLSLNEAKEILRKMPSRADFSQKLLKSIKNGEDVCPPHVIFSEGDFSLNFFTTDGKSLEVYCDGLKRLGKITFEPNKSLEVTLDEAENILEEFYNKIAKFRKVKTELSPLQIAILSAVDNGVSNSNAIAAMTGKSVFEVKENIRKLYYDGYLVAKKKGFFRKKYYYELTDKGRKTLQKDVGKVEAAVREDRDIMDNFAVAYWLWYSMNVVPDSVTSDEIVDTIGEPPATDEQIAELVSDSADHAESLAYDTDVDIGDGDHGDGDGDWGDGDADGDW